MTLPTDLHGPALAGLHGELRRTAFRSMGTDVVVLTERGLPREQEAIDAVRTLFEQWDATLSRFRPQSELSRLNAATGRPVPVSPLLGKVLRQSLDAAAVTDGLFDPTVHDRLVDLGYDRTFAEVVDGTTATATPAPLRPWRPGRWREIAFDRRAGIVRLPEGVALDFGGIAKGMAVDAATELLTDHAVVPAAVDAGGDLAVRGLPLGRGGWDVTVELPDGSYEVLLQRGALATSTTLRRRWRRDSTWRHHLIDPRTGLSADSDVVSVTVAATTCREAEVAAKTALILGSRDGLRLLRSLGMDGLVALADGRMLRVGEWAAVESA